MEVFEGNDQVSSTNSNFEEGGRGCRTKKRQLDPTCCPVCCVTLRQTEIDSHLHIEIEKLNKLPSPKIKLNGKSVPCSSNGSCSTSTSDLDKNWETYQKVRNNRQNRLRTKTRKRKADEAVCPVCNKEVSEDLTIHVELCLTRSEQNNGSDHDDENIDIETYEEYEWAGQSRVRATSLLPGGASSLGQTIQPVDEDEDLNVDGDGELYGSPQYSEQDIILPCEEAAEDLALRKAVMGSVPNRLSTDEKENSDSIDPKGDPVVQVLKNRIKELETRLEIKDEIHKCLICMERYQTPVISVCCWHVHCEHCWLQTLGAKKLCPQCNMITSVSDLRKIYM